MRKKFTAIALLCATISLMAAPTRTGASTQDETQPLESPLGIGLLPPSAQYPEQAWSVTGFRFNLLAGHYCDVFALDIGNYFCQDPLVLGIQKGNCREEVYF